MDRKMIFLHQIQSMEEFDFCSNEIKAPKSKFIKFEVLSTKD